MAKRKPARQTAPPADTMKRLLPTRARFQLTLYDRATYPKSYRALAGYRALVTVVSEKEVAALWNIIRAAIDREDWRDVDARATVRGDGRVVVH